MTSEKIAKLCAALSKIDPASIVSVWSTGPLFICRAEELRELVGDAVEAQRLRHTVAVLRVENEALSNSLATETAARELWESLAVKAGAMPSPKLENSLPAPDRPGVMWPEPTKLPWVSISDPLLLVRFAPGSGSAGGGRSCSGAVSEPVADVIGRLGSPHAAGFGPRNPMTGD